MYLYMCKVWSIDTGAFSNIKSCWVDDSEYASCDYLMITSVMCVIA